MSLGEREAFLGSTQPEAGFVSNMKTGGGVFVGRAKLANLAYILFSSILFFTLLIIFKSVDNKSCSDLNSLANFMIIVFIIFAFCSGFLLFTSMFLICCRSTCCGEFFDSLFDFGFTVLYLAKSLSTIFFTIATLVIAFGSDKGCKGAIRTILLVYAFWHVFIFVLWAIAVCCKKRH